MSTSSSSIKDGELDNFEKQLGVMDDLIIELWQPTLSRIEAMFAKNEKLMVTVADYNHIKKAKKHMERMLPRMVAMQPSEKKMAFVNKFLKLVVFKTLMDELETPFGEEEISICKKIDALNLSKPAFKNKDGEEENDDKENNTS